VGKKKKQKPGTATEGSEARKRIEFAGTTGGGPANQDDPKENRSA